MKNRSLFYRVVTVMALVAVLLPQGAGSPGRSAQAKGSITFTGHVITSTADAFSVYAADVDGDGDLDVLSASHDDNEIAWYENNGGLPPTFTSHVIATNAPMAHSVYAADVDGDGDIDVLSASYGDQVAWYENNGGSPPAFTIHVITTNTDGAQSVYAADVDGDGNMDVLSASMRDDKVAWYENNGGSPPAFTSHVVATSCDGAQSVYAADVNGDGDLDVLSACYDGDRIIWYENDGGSLPAFTSHVIATNTDAVETVYAADVDGDGDMDVLSASGGDDKIAWYENGGGAPPVFTSHIITTNADLAYEVYTADVDGDGDMDVLSASHFDAKIAWYENNGASPPVFTGHIITTNASGATSVYAADVDRDGDMDVLSASRSDDRVIWWENTGGGVFDFKVEDVWWSPDPPVAMSDSTIHVKVRNVGSTTYVPSTGEYVVGVKLIDTDKDPDDYWYYRFPGSGVPPLSINETWTFRIDSFWFTRPQVDQIKITFFPTDGDSNNADNVRTETITIDPASESLLDCLSLLLDVVTVYAATHGVEIELLEEISMDFILTLVKVDEAIIKEDWDKAWEEIITFVVNSGVAIAADLVIYPVKVAISLVKGFVSGAWNAWHCGAALADVIIGLVDDFNAKGVDINGAFAESPIYVMVINSSNQRVGFLDDGSVVNEITDAEVLQSSDGRRLVLYPGRDTESVTVTGSGAGDFDLTLAIAKADGSTHNVKYRNISVVTDTVGIIDATNTAYPLEIDNDGDGTIDRVESPSSITISWPGMVYLPIVLKSY